MNATAAPSKSSTGNDGPGITAAPLLSSITAKTVMAVSGLGLVVFVIAHMLGNLQIYLGQDALNAYAYKLKSMPALLWSARVGLAATFVVHIGLAFYLRKLNKAARPQAYVPRPG